MSPQRFTTTVAAGPGSQVYLPVPFDPDAVWGVKGVHHITGTVNGRRLRGPIATFGGERGVSLGAAWRRGCGVSVGDTAEAELRPEGPQRDELAPDLAEALAANPEAGAFFDSLATFYRRGYLRWVNATTRRPDLRAVRIAELITLLAAGKKERP